MHSQLDPEDIERELEKKVIFLDNFDEVYHRLKRDYKNRSMSPIPGVDEFFQYNEKIIITPNKNTRSISVSEYSPELIEDLKSNLYIKIKKFNFIV